MELLRRFETPEWDASLKTYKASIKSLKEKYAREREMQRIPVEISGGEVIALSPGGQNILIQKIMTKFIPMFVPYGKALYIGDTNKKFAHYDKEAFSKLGIEIDPHGKIPDLIIYSEKKNWLLLIEAVTSHGPINAKRMNELRNLFSKSTAGLIFITSFLDRRSMVEYLKDISWETEVWVAESPSHLIHFDGERFLGPYDWKL
jgi:BsuBI/PstI restriction endonuclease domain